MATGHDDIAYLISIDNEQKRRIAELEAEVARARAWARLWKRSAKRKRATNHWLSPALRQSLKQETKYRAALIEQQERAERLARELAEAWREMGHGA